MDIKKVREGGLLKIWLSGSYLEKNVKEIYEVIHASNYNKCFCQFPVDTIQLFSAAYKIVYCPTLFPSSKHLCKDVGVFVDENGYRRLALSDVPFKVKFQLS